MAAPSSGSPPNPALERNLLGAPAEAHQKVEIYSGVARMARTVWASEVRAAGTTPEVAVMICHPTANFMGHYALAGLAERGLGAVGFTSRYVGNDTALIMENCLLDMGAMVRFLYERGYAKVVLVGNSGGASIVPYYQAQARHPTVTDPPPGGGPDLTTAGLTPVDAIMLLNAHPSRARLICDWLDPSIVDERQPFERDPSLDMFNPANGPPFSTAFITRYRDAQVARNRRIAAWAEGQLRTLGDDGRHPAGLDDIAFVVPGTGADLRFLDGNIDPSDRAIGITLWGPPQVANYMPAGICRVTTLRAWLNQWSLDHTMGDSLRWLPEIDVPVGVVLGSADPAVVPSMAEQMHAAATTAPVRELHMVPKATHYFENQPELLAQALDHIASFVARHVTGAS
jgi:pimeloyl-ACP methyl ester carboxylesterase